MRDVCSLFSAFFMFLVNANHLSFFIRHKFKICSKQKISKNFSKELKFGNYRKQHRNRTFDFECWCKTFCRWKKKVLLFCLYLVHKVLLWNYLDQTNCTVIENTIICHITWESFSLKTKTKINSALSFREFLKKLLEAFKTGKTSSSHKPTNISTTKSFQEAICDANSPERNYETH